MNANIFTVNYIHSDLMKVLFINESGIKSILLTISILLIFSVIILM
jgi:hypothetical protein